jgi:hypothetical protein
MALEMLQAGKRSTAVFARKRLAVSGTLFLDFCLLVIHIWGLEFRLGGREGKEFEAQR